MSHDCELSLASPGISGCFFSYIISFPQVEALGVLESPCAREVGDVALLADYNNWITDKSNVIVFRKNAGTGK